MNDKYEMGNILTLEFLKKWYEIFEIAHIVTDGKYVQIEKEPTAGQQIGS